MAWAFSPNVVAATNNLQHWLFKEHLKANGFPVVTSGDGVSVYSSSGDVITSSTVWGNAGSWYAIAGPTIDGVTEYWCVQHSNNDIYRIKYGLTPFTGGSPSATRVPSSTTEQVMLGGGTDASPTYFNLYFNGSSGTFRSHFAANPTLGSFYGLGQLISNGNSGQFLFAQDRLKPQTYDVLDQAPSIVFMPNASPPGSPVSSNLFSDQTGNTCRGWYRLGLSGATFAQYAAMFARSNQIGSNANPDLFGRQPYADLDYLMPMLWGRTNAGTQPGPKGVGSMFLLRSFLRTDFQRYTVAGEPNEWIMWGPLAVPWPTGVANFFNASAPVGAMLARLDGQTANTTAPVVTVTGPLPTGGQITATTSLFCTVTDDQNAFRRILVTVRFPSLRLTEVVYQGNGNTDGFTEAYQGTSKVSTIANGYSFQLLRNPGWVGSPELRVYAIDVAGNEAP